MQSGEVMNFIDFQQLQIDNELSVKKIDEINKELLSLKKSYAKIVEVIIDDCKWVKIFDSK